ncbi:hypothetical protein HDV01_001734 [Terramyces sp. JEL0728]|nr:hypothetical protein HDV01_001734 [Terramyces sp. JEL0728]
MGFQNHKKTKGPEMKQIMNGLVKSLLFLAFMDWLAIGNFALATYTPYKNDYLVYNTMMTLSNTHTGFHGLFMIYVFKQLTVFTFIGTKSTQKKALANPPVGVSTQEQPTLDKSTITL